MNPILTTSKELTMSLEEALNKNTAAVEKHNELLEKMLASGGKATPAKSETTSKPAASTKAKPAASKAKPAASKAKPAAKAKTTVDDVAAAFGKYLKTGDSEQREEAKANVKSIVDYFGAAKATAIPEESWDEALGYLAQYEAGETPEFDGSPDDEGEEESLV